MRERRAVKTLPMICIDESDLRVFKSAGRLTFNIGGEVKPKLMIAAGAARRHSAIYSYLSTTLLPPFLATNRIILGHGKFRPLYEKKNTRE